MRIILLIIFLLCFSVCANAQEIVVDFNGISWGAEISSLNNMVSKGVDKSNPALETFIKDNEVHEWEGVRYKNADYLFFSRRLGMVALTVENKELKALRLKLNDLVKKGTELGGGGYCWSDGKLNIFIFSGGGNSIVWFAHSDFMTRAPLCRKK